MAAQKSDSPKQKTVTKLEANYAEVLERRFQELTGDNEIYVAYHNEAPEANVRGYIRKKKIVLCEADPDRLVSLFLDAVATRNVLFDAGVPEMYSAGGFKILSNTAKSEAMQIHKAVSKDVREYYEDSPAFKLWHYRKAGYVEESEYLESDEFIEKRAELGNNLMTQTMDIGRKGKPNVKNFVRVGIPPVETIIEKTNEFEKVIREAIHRRTEKDAVAKKLDKLYELDYNTFVLASIEIGSELRSRITEESQRLKDDGNLVKNIKDELVVRKMALGDDAYDLTLQKERLIIRGEFSFDVQEALTRCMADAKSRGLNTALLNKDANQASANGKLIEFTAALINVLHADDGSEEFERNLTTSGPRPA